MSDYETFICPTHGSEWAQVSKSDAETLGVPYGCQDCRAYIDNTPIPDTPEERVEQLRQVLSDGGAGSYAGFDKIWERVDALVGRGTLTHELAYPEYLEHEILTGLVPSVEGIVAKLPHDLPVIVVTSGRDDE